MAASITDKVRTIFQLLKNPRLLKTLLSLKHSQYLVDVGWINSFELKTPIDRNNNPIPWVTYPFIEFIIPRLKKEMEVFEFGGGSSTIFYAKRVLSVTTVEHNLQWFEKLKSCVPDNVQLQHKILVEDGEYSHFAANSEIKYDIIVVDGEDRNNCIKNSLIALKKDGVILLDDSERTEYAEAIGLLRSKSFKQLDFWGISPGYLNNKSTTVFYRPDNCLGI